MGHYGAEDSTSVTPVRGSLTDLSPKWDEVARGDEPQKCSQGPIVTPSPPSPPLHLLLPSLPPSLTSVSQPHCRLTSLSSGPIYESQVRSKSSAAILPHNSEPRNTKRGWGRRWGDSGGNVLVRHTQKKEVHAVCVFLSIFFLFFLLNYEEFTMAI